jgi:UPF0755 protein
MKTIVKIFLLALITVIIGSFLIKKNYDTALVTPNSESTEKVVLEIEQGASLDIIIKELVEKEVLQERWANYFKVYVRLNDIAPKIQAGVYEIPKNLNIKEIASTIQSSKNQDVWITIPEGLRKDEIARIIENEFKSIGNDNFSSTEFLTLTNDPQFISTLNFSYTLTNLEGYLFPDKYAFAQDTNSEEALRKLISNFEKKVGLSDTYEDIIIASMVEREGYTSEDRPMIADIIKRRYREGWLLQIDATLLYPKKDWKHVLTKQDLQEDNPYNTYTRQGYPPTPICNPGLQSIESVRSPRSNSYYYYIHDNNKNAHFAVTLADHNRNIQKYLR